MPTSRAPCLNIGSSAGTGLDSPIILTITFSFLDYFTFRTEAFLLISLVRLELI